MPALPDLIIRRYLRGRCAEFAFALSRLSGKPLYGMFDGAGAMHHVFVADKGGILAYDIRGEMPMCDVSLGSACEGQATCRPVTKDEVAQTYALPSRKALGEAETLIRGLFPTWVVDKPMRARGPKPGQVTQRPDWFLPVG